MNHGLIPYSKLVEILRTAASRFKGHIYTKGSEKATFLSSLIGAVVHNLDDYGCPKFTTGNPFSSMGVFPPRSTACIYKNHVTNDHCAQYKCIMYFEFLLMKGLMLKTSSPDEMFTNNPRIPCYERPMISKNSC